LFEKREITLSVIIFFWASNKHQFHSDKIEVALHETLKEKPLSLIRPEKLLQQLFQNSRIGD